MVRVVCFYTGMAQELSVLPSSIVAGESFTASLNGISTTGKTCVYSFAALTPFSVTCTIESSVFVLSVSAAQSLTLKSGNIRFAAMVTTTAGGAVECVDSGYLTVEPSPLATSNYSAALVAIDAAILTFASNPNKRVNLGTMSVEYKTLDELLSLRAFYQSEIQRDLTGTGSGPMRTLTRFAW